MATDFHISIVEGVVGYQFGDKGHLKLALTSAGAEEDNHDGNRTLAMIGEAAAQLAAVDSGYEKAASRGNPPFPFRAYNSKSFRQDTQLPSFHQKQSPA